MPPPETKYPKAVITEALPILLSFLTSSSSPTRNKRKVIPIEEKV